MQIEKKFTKYDFLVTVLCLVGFYFSLQLFNGVLNQSLDKLNEAPIGTITFKYKSAQRKLIDRVLWDRVKQNSPVYNGDIIRTAELSEATVTFVDGNVIDLYEQTLAQVFLDLEDGAAIDFSGGGVSIDTSSSAAGLTLTSGSANVQVAAGAVLNAASPLGVGDTISNQLSLQMTQGQAELLGADGSQSVSLSEGNGLIFDEATNAFIPPSIRVTSPAPNTKYLTQTETVSIPFTWEKENIASNEYIILETSQQKDFDTIVEQISFTNVNNISLDLDEGTWYWRVYTQSLSSSVGGKVQVYASPVPTNNVPAAGTEYTYRTKSPQVRFMWTDDEYARNWLFEIADNEQMTNPVMSQNTSQPSIIVNTLTDGRYYWRVTPTYSASFLGQGSFVMPQSQVSYFDVTEQGELTQAELILPLEGGFIDANSAEAGHHFTWKYDYEAIDYTIVISENENLSSPIVEQTVNDNFFVLYPDVATLTEGTWYWAVTKIDSEGEMSPQSDVRSVFSVLGRVEQRTLFPPDNYIVAENLVVDTSFTWKTNLPFNMKFQIAQDDDFENMHTERIVSSTSVSGLNLPTGTWYWRIVADAADSNIEYITDAKTLTVEPYLEKVVVSDLSVDTNVVVRPEVPMEFTWEASEEADYYQVQLFLANNRDNPVYEDLLVEETSISIDMDGFEEGEYVLALRAMAIETDSSSRQTGLLSEQTFDMKQLKPIELLTPINGAIIEGIDALLDPSTLEWSSVEVPSQSRLILTNHNYGLELQSRLAGVTFDEEDAYVYEIEPSEVYQLPSLPAGVWYWTVIAETEEGFDISPIQPSRFIVQDIEPFEVPTNVLPRTPLVIDMNYLRAQRYVDFSWDLVDEADGYIVSITDSNGSTVFEEIINDNTTYRFESFASLGRGNYYWTIEAIQRLPNAAIVRRGKKEEREFIIDLPVANAPVEQTTGELYGL